ncbi:ATP-dependent DNA helicase Q4-like [Uloborus diversus]|uniref:ATP-dependent DNA helicase Q4-like n=1 Tax=Uloborus diversus TaxID=327109 RepID=UPI0024095B75|nr:ATP-dependent DNA helicase Q4-like [Uloborus diversus]
MAPRSGLTDVQKKKSLTEISDGTAQILLVSPEAVIGSNAFGSGMLPADLPPISFACIDEAHCLSQWSHNFRPSYLQLYKALTQKLGVKCIFGLTATATNITAKDIISHLGLELTEESIVGHTNIPQNLHLSVSRDKDKDKALIQLLSGDRFRTCTSIIIYCIRRVETERLAALIRTTMQDEVIPSEEQPAKKAKKSKKRCFAWTVEAYHAGLTAPRRRSIQKQFMSGKLRVIVATVAFGMGVDKSDVRAIIHYNMPKTFESYVQEIGRAGRDGLDAQCHLFLDNECKDLYELRRHIYANGTDRHALRKLLQRVFQPCKCSKLSDDSSKVENVENQAKCSVECPKHEVAFSISDTVQELDMKEENILTLLCYLELYSGKWLEIQPYTYSTCTIRCYGGPKQMHSIACKSPSVATAIALDERQGKKFEKTSHYQFPVVQVASFMGLKSSAVKRELKGLAWNEQKRKTGVLVEFSDLAFHVLAPGNLSEDELDSILDYLQKKVMTSEKQELENLNSLFSVFQKYSSAHYWSCCDEANLELSQKIKEAVNTYFTRDEVPLDDVLDSTFTENEPTEDMLLYARSQIRDLICTHRDQEFSGRAIARIFHGITSPCYPSEIWGKVRKFWRSFLHIDFNILHKIANEELKTYR